MKAILIDELAAINLAIHADAMRIGCEEVRISGLVWPGGRISGPAGEEMRVVEYSWKKAAVVKGEAVFEEDDPAHYAALLQAYGLGEEESYATPEEPAPELPPDPRLPLTAFVRENTKLEIQRRAAEAGLSVGEFLDRLMAPAGPSGPPTEAE